MEGIVSETQAPVGRETQEPPLALDGHLAEEHEVSVLRGTAVERIIRRERRSQSGVRRRESATLPVL